MTAPPAPASGVGERVRSAFLSAGFDRVGFARAGRAPHADRFEEWLRRGHAAGMSYLARSAARRVDPRAVVEGARSVVAVALHYAAGSEPDSQTGGVGNDVDVGADGRAHGFVARYARGADYHRVMEGRLRQACRELGGAFPEDRFRYYVDTGPVLERAWAELAGIGWIGKNACAIDPVRGSYFFIGVVITTMDLDPDPPGVDHCGTCRLCIDACPTSAIVEPYRVDSALCISYQTIENRGAIPAALRPAHADMVFGCDVCQEVCPFNRPRHDAPGAGADPDLEPRRENAPPVLAELAGLEDVEAFRRRFPRSAVRRARFAGFLRNVLIAIGNSGDARLVAVLDAVAERPHAADPIVAEALRWARERLESAAASR